MVRIRIENVVASTSLGEKFDLRSIALRLPGAEYDPDQFPGLIYRLKNPPTAILLFQSGKVVCTGGKSRKQVEDAIRTVSQEIRASGQSVLRQPKIEVQNIVATSSLGSQINLTSIAVALGLDRVEYEPEQFPGLVFRMDQPQVVLLLFGSGKLVCTGARRPSDVLIAVRNVVAELQTAGLLPQDRAPSPSPKPTRTARPSSRPARSPAPTAPGPSPPDGDSTPPRPVSA